MNRKPKDTANVAPKQIPNIEVIKRQILRIIEIAGDKKINNSINKAILIRIKIMQPILIKIE